MMEELKELWQGVDAYDTYLKCRCNLWVPICGQSMIIWHLGNSPASVSMVDSIFKWIWMNLMHSGFSTTGKSVSLIAIENSFP
jgi:hypothetical protein